MVLSALGLPVSRCVGATVVYHKRSGSRGVHLSQF